MRTGQWERPARQWAGRGRPLPGGTRGCTRSGTPSEAAAEKGCLTDGDGGDSAVPRCEELGVGLAGRAAAGRLGRRPGVWGTGSEAQWRRVPAKGPSAPAEGRAA